jgi:hypothetical protein
MVEPYLSSVYKDKDSLVAGWRDIHIVIANKSTSSSVFTELLGYSTYYYTAYKAFGQEQDAVQAKELLGQLLTRLAHHPLFAWTAAQLDQMIVLAWLHTELVRQAVFSEDKVALLTQLDERLLSEAAVLARQPASSPSNLLRIVRYFHLRLPDEHSAGYWQKVTSLVEQAVADKKLNYSFPKAPASLAPGSGKVMRLGLTDGLAGDLLLLIQLAEVGPLLAGLREQVRQGILYILSTKREVDFSDQRYAIFPAQINSEHDEATFSNELNWGNGDIGQALLLYKGYKLLQDEELAYLAQLVGLNTLLRTDVCSTDVTSSELASGAAGVAHLYRKLYQLSGHDAYRKGYAFWLTQTHTWLSHELSTDFYQHREGDLLHGLVGVALVLLSAISDEELHWDRVLL